MNQRTWTAVLGLILLCTAALAGWSYKTVQFEVDGHATTFRGFAWTVRDALASSGISVAQGDQVEPGLNAWLGWKTTVHISRAAQVVIVADGKQTVLLSDSRIPTELLAQANIILQPGDQLLGDGQIISPGQPLPAYGDDRRAPLLVVQRQITLTLSESNSTEEISSPANTLGQALWQHRVAVYSADRLEPAMDTLLVPGLVASLIRARTVTIVSDAITRTLPTSAERVGTALAQAGLVPLGMDYSIPPENEPLPEDGRIRLVRVHEEVLIEQTPLPFETSYQAAADLEIDNQTVLQAGVYGINARRVRVRYEDGVEISRTVEAEWVAQPPQTRIIGYGTNVVPHTMDTPDGPITYWRALRMYAVSYHPGSAGGETTASGLKVAKGLVAVDTSLIPLFTQLYIPGYGPAMAADTGGGVKGRIIDLGYTTDEYVAWHEYVTVYFLWPPPATIVWIIP